MVRTVSVAITSREGGQSGSTTTDELDDSLLREAVARSEALMAAARPDPEQVEGLEPAALSDDPRVRRADRGRRARPSPRRRQGGPRPGPRARARRLRLLRDTARSGWRSPTRRGTSGSIARQSAEYSTTMRTADGTGSGYARLGSPRLSDIDPAGARRDRGAEGRDLGEAPRAGRRARTPSSSSPRPSPTC